MLSSIFLLDKRDKLIHYQISFCDGKKKPFIQSSWKGIDYIKSVHSGKYRLSECSKLSAGMMRIASPVAKQFRLMFMPVIPFARDRTMQTTFVGVVKKWMKYKKENPSSPQDDLTCINHFQFNSYSSLQDRLHVSLHLSLQQPFGLLLEIPAIVPAVNISAPVYTSYVTWKIMTGCCTLKNPV